jgi:hypothetical protein
MFAYSDPTGTGFLQQVGALSALCEKVHDFDRQFGSVTKSGFTPREAFQELAQGKRAYPANTGAGSFQRAPIGQVLGR